MTGSKIKSTQTDEKMMIDHMEEAKVPFSDYQELEEKYEKLQYQMQDVINFLKNNDIIGAYEYLASEGLV